jgi:methionyl-tRNA synthetase
MTKKRYTVTSALLYANGPIHLGHISGAYLPADIFVRYLKGKGHDVAFICGSDEHGAAITLQAKKDGVTPQEIFITEHPTNYTMKLHKIFSIPWKIKKYLLKKHLSNFMIRRIISF